MNLRTHSEAGGKIENEDFILVKRHPENSGVRIVALADGQGGRAHGAAAARAACEAVWEAASALASEELFKDGTWLQILQAADRAAALTGGFTTLVALALDADFAAGASCGDSKAYFRHSGTQELAEWTIHQPKNPPIGSECADAEPFMCLAIGGGRLMVVSDGVWKYCGYEALKAACGVPLEQVVEHLRSAAVARSGAALPDDFSLVVVDLE